MLGFLPIETAKSTLGVVSSTHFTGHELIGVSRELYINTPMFCQNKYAGHEWSVQFGSNYSIMVYSVTQLKFHTFLTLTLVGASGQLHTTTEYFDS